MRLAGPWTYDLRVRINEERFGRLARSIMKALHAQGYVKPKVPDSQLVERITRVFVDNMVEEQRIEEEAERLLNRLGRQAQGMDQRKILLGLKERIAKEKGFSL